MIAFFCKTDSFLLFFFKSCATNNSAGISTGIFYEQFSKCLIENVFIYISLMNVINKIAIININYNFENQNLISLKLIIY